MIPTKPIPLENLPSNGTRTGLTKTDINNPGSMSIADDVFGLILKYIQTNNLKVGDRLPSEGKMTDIFGASRSPIREAISALSQMGVINVQNGRRPEVAKFTGEKMAVLIDHAVKSAQVSVFQTWDMRRTIEIRIARLTALRRTDEDLIKIRMLTDQLMRAQKDKKELTKLDVQLHLAWAAASKNPLYLLHMESLRKVMENTGPIGWAACHGLKGMMLAIDLHLAITDAIAAQDADLAEQLMSQHFDQATSALLDAGLE